MGVDSIIDFSSHILPGKVMREVKELGIRYSPAISRYIEGVFMHSHYSDSDIPRRIDILKEFGITYQVVSLAPNHIWLIEEGDPVKRDKLAMRLARVANDAIADIVERYRDHFIGMATLPILHGEAVDELRRSIRDLGLRGVQIYSNIYGSPIDSDENMEFYNAVSSLEIPVFIHPQTYEYYPWIYEYNLFQIFGWPFDTSLAMGRLVFAGITRKYPSIPFVAHHVGGMIPYYRGRIAGAYGTRELYGPGFKVDIPDPLGEFKKFYADTASFGVRETIEMGIGFFGEDRIVFGTDYPFGPEKGLKYLRETLNAIMSMGIDDEKKEKILFRNAARLLRIS